MRFITRLTFLAGVFLVGYFGARFCTPLSDALPAFERERFSTGTTDVHVYFCAPANQFDDSYMQDEVARIDTAVGDYFRRESSNLASVRFVLGGVVSPPGVDWANGTISQWSAAEARHDLAPCEDPRHEHRDVLVLADVTVGGSVTGFAYSNGGLAVTSTFRKYSSQRRYGHYLAVIAHEIGHSLFGLSHTADRNQRCTADNYRSLMNASICPYRFTLNNTETLCTQRTELGWPCDTTPPPTPDPDESNGQDMSGVGPSGADLSSRDLSNSNLAGADLSGANLTDTNLSNSNLAGADLSGANLTDTNLSNSNLAGADLSGANLTDTNLSNSNLAGADLSDAHMCRVDFVEANLAGVVLTETLDGCTSRATADQ